MSAPPARWLRVLLLTGLASVALYGASCSDGGGEQGGGGHGGGDPLADVIYEGAGNDEALELLLAETPIQNGSTYAMFDAPVEGLPVPASPIPTFAWHVEGLDMGALTPTEQPRSRWASIDGLNPVGSRVREALGPLLDLVGPERSARAHGSFIGGAAYLLVFSTTGNDNLLRVFTTNLTYTPDEAAWATLKGAGHPIQAWILTGIYDANQLVDGGGPFQGPWIAFNIE
jgi:hypothetical protein